MAKNSEEAYGASGRTNLLLYDPEDLVIVTDKKSALYDERADLPVDEALVASVMAQGVLEPILIRKNPETGKPEVVNGRRRTLATREANRRLTKRGEPTLQVPARIFKSSEDAAFGAMIATNEIRRNDSPVVRAEKMRRAVERGMTEPQIAVFFGVTPATVKNLLGTLEASAPVRKALAAGTINASDAYKLSKLEPTEQKTKLAALLEHAPKTPGKRRKRGEGAKAKRAHGDGFVKSFATVNAMLDEIGTADQIRENDRKVAVAVLQWVLGADDAIEAFYTPLETEQPVSEAG